MHVIHRHSLTLSPPFLTPRLLSSTPLTSGAISFRRSSSPLFRNASSNLKVARCSGEDDRLVEPWEAALLVESCITRTLPPALTLEQGLNAITEALDELKSRPHGCASGMYRFQVAVPPKTKAMNWFCRQLESSGVFPQFFLSEEVENTTFKELFLNRTRGVFGLGASFIFKRSCIGHLVEYTDSRRYLTVESNFIMAYGFIDMHFDSASSAVKHEIGSFYLFIPQIELNEFGGFSVLAATIAWNNSSLGTLEKALQNCEFSLDQACHFLPIQNKSFTSSIRKFSMVKDMNFDMACTNILHLDGKDLVTNSMEMKNGACSRQFCARLSSSLAIGNKMCQPDHTSTRYALKDFGNLNSLWAFLIIEECTRLGLTYFCIAPGSRSSPLAVAASSHPLTTCIACFDERALAFHAVGYARGTTSPAVIITSSGTAVSNLLPAVVEASQDFVPVVVLTADRPPELQDSGANQAINQVNHYGSFVRNFFDLPTPSDELPARMVLTTIDSAVYTATTSPSGPVHINCPFREPLDGTPRKWNLDCLRGLKFWMSGFEPFTSYIQMQQSSICNDTHSDLEELLKVIQHADKGILLIGALHSEDDIWAALLLAKHLSWPVAADILSGLRLRKYFTFFSEIKGKILFVDHLDHLLLSNSVKDWIKADVVIQIGSRITSKRISQMLEDCCHCSYIVVDRHPNRHDPSHVVTHRVQCSVSHFTDWLLKTCVTHISDNWSVTLKALNMMAAWEIEFIICSECSLTEPYAARIVLDSIHCNSAIFVGNSMPIRDADMYGSNWAKCTHGRSIMSRSGPSCHWIQVAGNRGASGIDGLLSTAVGFAIGCNKRVLCLIGDISFLHDTNGMALLRKRLWRKPMTILLINNRGGGIFSLLPIAERIDQQKIDEYFHTSHNVSIQNLCVAHDVKHVFVQTKMELQDAILKSQIEEVDYVIEVGSFIDANATFHSYLREFTCKAADHSLGIILRNLASDSMTHGFMFCKIKEMKYSLYRVRLHAPPTSVGFKSNVLHREGFIITLTLDDGNTGFGEVAPLEINKENILDVEQQLRFLIHTVEGAKLDYFVPLLRGSFSCWIQNSLGIMPGSIFPSVQCGLEMAVLNALSAREGSCLLDVLYPQSTGRVSTMSSYVRICALVDSNGSPAETAFVATQLLDEGFAAIKLKVGRRSNPLEDAAVVHEVRKKVGNQMTLRVDANRKWTYDEAVQFGFSVKHCGLQYIEEPVSNEDDIVRFCEDTGLPVALDETLGSIKGARLEVLAKFTHPGIAAVVIKPSIIGGFENAALVARWAHQHGKIAVMSAAFESGLSMLTYIQFSRYLELQNADLGRILNKEPELPVAHGLGTYKWFKEDVTKKPLDICRNLCSGFVEASVVDTGRHLKKFKINDNSIIRTYTVEQIHKYRVPVDSEHFCLSVNVQEVGSSLDDRILVFLHGFLGTSADWTPIMKSLSASARCIAIDLPGHGGTTVQNQACNKVSCSSLSIEIVSEMLCKLFQQLTPRKVILVGYSMGARIALYMSLKCSDKVEGVVIMSGSPGLKDIKERETRNAKDDFRAFSLVSYGLEAFLEIWYSEELWESLRCHPHFEKIVKERLNHYDIQFLAKVLSDLSIGRQPSLWEDLEHCRVPLLLVVGDRDTKFKKIAKEMCSRINQRLNGGDHPKMVEIPTCGHAVHLENPLPVISAIRQFLTSMYTCSWSDQS